MSSLAEYRLSFMMVQRYPELQGKPSGPYVRLSWLTHILYLIELTILTCT